MRKTLLLYMRWRFEGGASLSGRQFTTGYLDAVKKVFFPILCHCLSVIILSLNNSHLQAEKPTGVTCITIVQLIVQDMTLQIWMIERLLLMW